MSTAGHKLSLFSSELLVHLCPPSGKVPADNWLPLLSQLLLLSTSLVTEILVAVVVVFNVVESYKLTEY